MMGRCEITEEEIVSKQTAAGGWTRKQLARWGVPWPAPSGWKKRILKFGIPYEGVDDLHAGDGQRMR